MALIAALVLAGWACWRFRRYTPWLHYIAAAGSGVLLVLMFSGAVADLPENRAALGANALMLLGNGLVMAKARSGLALASGKRNRALTDLRVGLTTGANAESLGPGSLEQLQQAGEEERGVSADLGAAFIHCFLIVALNAAMILASRA